MTDPRAPIFAAVRAAAPAGLFNDPLNTAALDNLLDAFGVARAGASVRAAKHVLHDAPAFFAAVRKITGPLDQVQVDTVNRMLAAAAHWPASWLAYGFATAWHEARLRPIREKGNGDGPDADKWDDYLEKYDTGGLAKALGNTPEADGDGVLYAGRGLVQLTGRTNYAAAGQALGVDLLSKPDLALDPDIATRILVWGMSDGSFTGKSLRSYLPEAIGTYDQFVQARRIINGTDKADLIARYAGEFQKALVSGVWS